MVLLLALPAGHFHASRPFRSDYSQFTEKILEVREIITFSAALDRSR
jgi:hypothetical protein